jgi:hypothetical protein
LRFVRPRSSSALHCTRSPFPSDTFPPARSFNFRLFIGPYSRTTSST